MNDQNPKPDLSQNPNFSKGLKLTTKPDSTSRRNFFKALSLGFAGLALSGSDVFGSSKGFLMGLEEDKYAELCKNLLKVWCDGMLKYQINEPENPSRHGGLDCPACGFIHGRNWEAVYPFLHMARATGEKRYLDAAINVFEWSKNVTGEDGRWTNDLDPKSWPTVSVFGAISLAESLHHHGDLLDEARRNAWTDRLKWAIEGYLLPTFKKYEFVDYANINYGFTAIYGFNLFGHVLHEPSYIEYSRELATHAKKFFTEPNKFIFGESRPRDGRSARGLLPIDLGYNVEESLNNAVLYAIAEKDEEFLQLLTKSLQGHLEFMLPDGGWDNSWGTRQAKWTYWGSRTSDGCQPAFSFMADRDPAFGAAAFRNTELLQRCTHEGLLYGGLHYVSHGIKPCIHHTFAHAKVLALLQDERKKLPKIDPSYPLPRETAKGAKLFTDLEVTLASMGPWSATISAYDVPYRIEYVQQATGGSLAVLHHKKVGPLFTASMAEFMRVEPKNMQKQPQKDFAFTPRIETRLDDKWFTNLYDLKAEVTSKEEDGAVEVKVLTTLQDRDRVALADDVSRFNLDYRFDSKQTTIRVRSAEGSISKAGASLILPLISPTGESVRQVSPNRIEVTKPEGVVVVEASVPLKIFEMKGERIFNMVPGVEAIPLIAQLPSSEGMEMSCTITVM